LVGLVYCVAATAAIGHLFFHTLRYHRLFRQPAVPATSYDTIAAMRNRLILPFLLLCATEALFAAKELEIYFVDVEGGQATLIVPPSKQALLVDTGWPGMNSRDALRIAAAAKKAGVKEIDYLLITHYHTDHVGGVPQLVAKMHVKTFIDHGATVEHGGDADRIYHAYLKARDGGRRAAESRMRNRETQGSGPERKRAVGRDSDPVRQLPHGGYGRSHLEQGERTGLPE
jgi:glyoxylase-like metal-dependent hydrolase (beta-lactamase superfamily II)